jgi:putative ATPase
MNYGKNYRYAHDEDDGFVAGETYFPEGLAVQDFYRPVPRGLEIKIAEKLQALRDKNAAHK